MGKQDNVLVHEGSKSSPKMFQWKDEDLEANKIIIAFLSVIIFMEYWFWYVDQYNELYVKKVVAPWPM